MLSLSQNLIFMKGILTICLLFALGTISAQVSVLYKGDSTSDYDIAYKIENGLVYHGNSSFSRLVYYTILDNKIFLGQTTSTFKCLYTIDGGKVYKGDSRFSSDLIYTIQNNKVYRGDFPMSSNCVLTLDDHKIYMGDSTFPTDILFTLNSNPVISLAILAAIIGPY